MPPIDLQADDTGDDSIRASLVAAMDETPEPSTESADRPTDPPPDPAPGAAADPSQAQSAPPPKADHPTDPKRYSDGSFKSQKTEAAPDKAAPVATNDPSKDATKASPVPASTPVSAPPAGWTAAEKAEWAKLPPAVQAAVSRREAEMSNGGKQWSDEKRRFEAMLAPVAESARARGMNAEQGLQTLMAAQRALDTDPVSAIKHIARSYGVDLATLAGTQAADGSREVSQQPDINALVRQAVQPLLAPIQQRYAAEEHARQQSTVDFVTTFATAPGHEHFDAVQNELMAMIPSIKAENPVWSHDKVLQEAYDRATYANPTTRAAILAQREADAEAKRVADAKARSQAARLAGSSVTGAPSGAPSTAAKDTLRGELEAAFAGA